MIILIWDDYIYLGWLYWSGKINLSGMIISICKEDWIYFGRYLSGVILSTQWLLKRGHYINTCSLLVEPIISLRPIHTPCLSSFLGLSNPFSNIGIISGNILSPSLRTRSPRVLAAICNNDKFSLISVLTVIHFLVTLRNYKQCRK